MRRLRSPEGCPWDREQTFSSIRPHTLEEVYEVFDAIDRANWPDLCDELGDLLLQVLFYSQVAADEGSFTIGDVVAGLNRKLIRRHPHVFGEEAAAAAGNRADLDLPGRLSGPSRDPKIGAAQVLRNWEAIKRAEKTAKEPSGASALDSISRAMPALFEARKLGSRAQNNGFDWPNVEGLFDKLEEEITELRQAIAGRDAEAGAPAGGSEDRSEDQVAQEIGDLLFTVVNLSRHLKIDPEFALRESSAKFRRRFAFMEEHAPGSLETLSLSELELLWSEAKKTESAGRGAAK